MAAAEHKLAVLPARLKELDNDLAKLQDMLTAEHEKLEQSRAFQASQRHILEDEEDQIRNSKARAGQAKNPRELGAAQREIESTRRMIQARTDELAKIATAIDEASQRVATMEQALAELRVSAEQERERLNTEAEAARSALEKLAENRSILTAEVHPDILRTYQRIRMRSGGGIGFVSVRNRRCSACKMQVPHQHYTVLRRGSEILPCENCGRLLYWAGHFDSKSDGDVDPDTKAKQAIAVAPRKRAATS